MKGIAVLVVFSAGLMVLVAQESQSPASKVVSTVLEEFDKAKTDADEKFEKSPAVVSLQTARFKAVERAGKIATTKLEKLMAESKKAGSDLGIESAKQGIEDVAGTVQNAKLASVGMDKMVVKFKGHSYLAILRPITWYDADKLCKSLGGHLAYVASKEDMEFLQKLTRVGGVWVGASDENKEGDWRWTNGMTVMGSLWAHDRPYKAHGLNCAALQQDGLADLNCKDLWPVGFICQWD